MIKVSGPSLDRVDRTHPTYLRLANAHPKIAQLDSTLWGEDAREEASIRLNWVNLPAASLDLLPQLASLCEKFAGFTEIILCGMGGSSLAPEVFAKTFASTVTKKTFIVDSTDPDYIARAIDRDLSKTIIVVGSKSGSTIETSSQRAFFESHLVSIGLNPVDHIVFVTDPGSPLDTEARGKGFTVINADPHVGGRFSGLSAFGLVPASLAGIDVEKLLRAAQETKEGFLNNPTAILDVAFILTEIAGQYIGFTDSGSSMPGISDWIEQLIAESTGKDQKGRLPIVVESISATTAYGAFGVAFVPGTDLCVEGDLSSHMIFWEWVTALLGVGLAIDPFNQPNVTEAKEQTAELLKEWNGSLPTFTPTSLTGNLEFHGYDLQSLINQVEDSGYLAIMAYLDRAGNAKLEELRAILASKIGKPVTFGWGPRFMHSTGQFHKAGQPNGCFLQVTGTPSHDFEIPGRGISFNTLISAQALGDGRALAARKYPTTRIHLKDRAAGLEELLTLAKNL